MMDLERCSISKRFTVVVAAREIVVLTIKILESLRDLDMQLPEGSAIVTSEQLACERPIVKEMTIWCFGELDCLAIMTAVLIKKKSIVLREAGRNSKVESLHSLFPKRAFRARASEVANPNRGLVDFHCLRYQYLIAHHIMTEYQ